jgi:transposase-like protein
LAVIDGNPGLHAALRAQWPEIAVQRCTNHKLRNLLAKAPAHLREELAEDYRRMMYAETREAANKGALASCASGACGARRLSVRSKKLAMNCSPSCGFLPCSGSAAHD